MLSTSRGQLRCRGEREVEYAENTCFGGVGGKPFSVFPRRTLGDTLVVRRVHMVLTPHGVPLSPRDDVEVHVGLARWGVVTEGGLGVLSKVP